MAFLVSSPMQRKCQNWLTLFVVLPRIGRKKLQTDERTRKTAIKNHNKKQRAANFRSLLPGLYPPPGTSPN